MPKTKAEKRLDAEERRNDYELRSVDEHLAELANRPGQSTRERERLIQVQKEINGVTVPRPKTDKRKVKK